MFSYRKISGSRNAFYFCRKALDHKNENYEAILEKSVGFNNPNNISYLAGIMGIDEHCTLMQGLR